VVIGLVAVLLEEQDAARSAKPTRASGANLLKAFTSIVHSRSNRQFAGASGFPQFEGLLGDLNKIGST
jgi:hypothetical protein